MAKRVEIVSIGNELLIGKTLNTNAQWLARRITTLGLSVSRITTVGDDIEQIAKAMQEAIDRKPDFIITTGGLGPTFDDKTLEGVAETFGSKLQVNEKALNMVEAKYERYAKERRQGRFELTPARVKMAKIPDGAEPLPNPVGTAPAIVLKKGSVIVFALPGVPPEMEAIFEDSLASMLKSAAGNLTFFETSLYVEGVMESEMAPFIDQVMHDNPYVYVKSHPMGAEKKPHLELHLSTTDEDSETAKKRVGRALMQLSEIVRAKGGKTKTAKASQ
jgi:nicotinamide-nucleotide amidase